jgi:hypothetical protein
MRDKILLREILIDFVGSNDQPTDLLLSPLETSSWVYL